MSKITLGLDLGPSSIGWAIVDEDKDTGRIVDLGVRIFPEGVENFDSSKERSRNEDRRIARGMRRQIARRSRRKRKLLDALIAVGMFPSDSQEQNAMYHLNPYELRTKALDEKLTLHELGRVLLQLNQRRGFKSNKKEEAKAEAKATRKKASEDSKNLKVDAEKKTEDILLEMDELEQAIKQSGARTLGEYLHRKLRSLDHKSRENDDRIRGRHTKRKMLMDEFNAIWTEQSNHYRHLLTDQLCFGNLGRQKVISRPIPKSSERRKKSDDVASFDLSALPNPEYFERKVRLDLNAFGLFGLTFFHRTLKPVPKEIVGLCELESSEQQKGRLKRQLGVESDDDLPPIDIRRCPRADRHAQRFRLLQEVNNLRLIDGRKERPLNKQERALILEKLSRKSEWTFDAMRKELGKLPNSPPAKSIEFNLEKGKRKKLQGMQTDYELAKVLGKSWYERPESEKDGIVRALIHSVDDDETHETLTRRFGLSSNDADSVLSVDLTGNGYVKFCLHAIDELMPFLEQEMRLMGNDETDSAMHAAGYLRRDELQRRLFDKLPDPARMNPRDCPIGDIPNPVVKRALVELRKVVNAIIREQRRLRNDPHWKPDAVHVEMGRDVKTRPKDPRSLAYRKHKEHIAEMREREAKRDDAKKKLRENGFGYGAGGNNIVKYLLWQEQDGDCIYSGKPISFSKLMSEEVEIDHILPYSQSLDNSPVNKVVCYGSENHPATGKGQRTPRGWLEHSDPKKYEQVCQRAKKLPYAKRRRFLQLEVDLNGCIQRQLNDTRYIATATVEFLRLLFEKKRDHEVKGLKGQLTSTLRRMWGLDTVLSEIPDSPAWQEQAKLRPGQKNRADHRHHAIDALVVALTSPARLQKLARGFVVGEFTDGETGDRELKTVHRGERVDKPWEYFRDHAVEQIQRIDGCDHGESDRRGVSHRTQRKVAGALHADTFYGRTPDRGVFVARKPLEKCSASEITNIVDSSVKSGKKGVKQIVIDALQKKGVLIQKTQPKRGKPKTFFADVSTGNVVSDKDVQAILFNVKMPSGVPIKKVRIHKRDKTIQAIRNDSLDEAFVRPDATHHLCIFEWEVNGKLKHAAVFVTQLEAINRVKRQQQALNELIRQWNADGLNSQEIERRKVKAMSEIAREHPVIQPDANELEGDERERIPSDAEFKMSLSKGEMLLLEIDDQDRLYVYNTAASTTFQMKFYPHTAAKHKGKQHGELKKYPGSLFDLNPRKVTVDPLGRIRYAERFVSSDALGQIDPEVAKFALDFVAGRLSNRQAKKLLKTSGRGHLGAQFTAEVHRLRSESDAAND